MFEEGKYWSTEEKKNKEGKGEKYLKRGKKWSTVEKKNGEGKGGNHFEKEI